MSASQKIFSQKNKRNLIQVLSNNFETLGLFKLDNASFVKITQDCIPESAFLKGKAKVSAEGNAEQKPTKDFYGLSEDEEIRAFSGLLRFKDVISGTDEDYKAFIACQIEMKKPVLSRESFNQMRQYVLDKLKSPEDFAAAIWSILCNDLGKVHAIIDAYKNFPHKETIGHDVLLAEMLKEKPEMFPGFMCLTEKHRKQIIDGYASGCDISQFEQLELPEIALNGLKVLDQETLDLYVLHSIFDVSGAAAHFKSNGSLTMHQETWNFFNATRTCLEKIYSEKSSIEEVYTSYLQFRGNCIGIKNNSAENSTLIRIAGLARFATVAQGNLLKEVWESLDESVRKILTAELSEQGVSQRAIFIGYGVAMLMNAQGAMQRELNDSAKISNSMVSVEQRQFANKEGLRIGLINMSKAFTITRQKIGSAKNNEIFVAECDLIARALNKNPKHSLDMQWEITASCDRRLDFQLKEAPSLVHEEKLQTTGIRKDLYRINKDELIELRQTITEQLNKVPEKIVLLETKWNLNKVLYPLIRPTINAILEIYDSIIDDLDDSIESYWLSSLASGSGEEISSILSIHRQNIEKATLTQSNQFKQELDDILSMMDVAYTAFHKKEILEEKVSVWKKTSCQGPKSIDWNEHRIRIEQQILHSDNTVFIDTLYKVKQFGDINSSIIHNFNYLCCVVDTEAGNVKVKHEDWTYTFVKTLSHDLKMAGVNILSSQSGFDSMMSVVTRMQKIKESQNIILLGTQSFMHSMQQYSTSTSCEMTSIINHVNDGTPIIPILLSGTKESSLPIYRNLYDVKLHSYLEIIKFLVAKLYNINSNSPLYQEFEKLWVEANNHFNIPKTGMSEQQVKECLLAEESKAVASQKQTMESITLLLNKQQVRDGLQQGRLTENVSSDNKQKKNGLIYQRKM